MTSSDIQCLLAILGFILVLVFLRSLLFRPKQGEPENQIQSLEMIETKPRELEHDSESQSDHTFTD